MAWLVVLGFALVALHREWAGFHYADLRAALGRLGWRHVGLALVCTALSYASNAALDLFSLRWLGLRVPWWRAFGASQVATVFSLNAGGTFLGGGGVRMRLYTGLGVTPGNVTRMAGFAFVAGWAGHALMAGVFLCLAPQLLPWVGSEVARGIGMMAILSVAGALGFIAWRGGRSEKWPPLGLACGAVLLSALDWFLAGLAIRVLLPGDLGEIGTAGFLGAVIVGQLLGSLSHVPGGVGVLELSITKLVGAALPAAGLAAALMLYRLIYYLVPFAIAAGWMGLREAWMHRHHAVKGAEQLAGLWQRIGPRLGSLLALAGGFVLLLSANTPMPSERRDWLGNVVPLPFIEASHFLSSVVGMALIVVARGLQRRVQAAWWATVVLAVSGIVFSLLKGWDYEEAGILTFVLLCLIPFRSHFYRHSALWSRRFTPEWWLLIGSLLLIATWLGFFSHRHVEYQNELWWRFSLHGDASRFLRGMVGMAVVLGGVLLAQWLRPGPGPKAVAPSDLERVARLVSQSPQSQAHLALLGDKQFHFSKSGEAFLMYGDQGRSRIVMGDPVGDEDEWDELLWTFGETAEDEGYRICHYEISAASLPRLVDMGMRFFKLGEEARVSLEAFEIGSPEARKLRQARSRAERDGLAFAIWSPDQVSAGISQLRAVSDDWLTAHADKEKGFSLGYFDETYLCGCPVAVILRADDVVAFANLWCSGMKRELSIDLMRHNASAPAGVMDYLFTELLLWGKAEGYRVFNLGMAPLSGMSTHPLAPLWQKLSGLVYLRGGAFYNFKGLREFKDKFRPEWQARYLAIPSSWHLPSALLDVTSLIGSGNRRNSASNRP